MSEAIETPRLVSEATGEQPELVRSLYSPTTGIIACVLLQAGLGGDRRPCHCFDARDWEVGFPDDTFGWVSLTMDQWRKLGSLPRQERIDLLAPYVNAGVQA